ncbi:MAG: LuxR C-terminal-related transcriptional regulator [Thermomicrobiales bacterium]|nr:LuxR C-terminal-related transcriptional regulator [Thermomicrobiales bacterium]
MPLTPNRSEFPELLLLETLSSLVTKSLVQALDDPIDPAEPEYSMLEIIRSFGAEQLASHGDELVLRKRHLDHFTAMSARWSEALSTPKRDVRLAQFDREYPNLHAALDWAVLSGNRTAGLRLVAALWVYWDWRGFHAEGARWSDAVLALGGESDPALLAKALYAGSAIAFMQANYARSMELAEACLAAAEASGDEQAIARGLVALGNSTYDLGQLDRSNDIYTRALAMSRAGKNEQALQVSLVNLGYVSYQLARFDAAAELFREAIALESGTGRSAAASWARVGAAQTHHQLGELDAAEAELRDIIEMQRSADTGQLAAALTALSAVLRALGRHADAEPLIREAVANRVERDERALLTDSLGELAAVALAAGAELDGVTLASAVASQRDRIGYGLPDRERLAQIATVESLRSRLDKDDFGRAWERGARMTIVEAVAFANQLELSGSEPVGRESEALAVLTPREREVVCLIIEGRTDREIAAALSITAGTASRHVANILHKLDVPNRSAAAAWAIRNGLT